MITTNNNTHPKYSKKQVHLIDLHTHLRGTISPFTLKRISDHNKTKTPKSSFDNNGKYHWKTFEDFLRLYDISGKSVNSPSVLEEITTEYLQLCARENVAYIELMISPLHSIENGIPFSDQITSIQKSINEVKRSHPINVGIIATCVRHKGPRSAIETIEIILDHKSDILVGFGLTGNEEKYSASDFSYAFSLAAENSLGLTAHTGEWSDARSIIDTVDALSLSRIGHGIRAVDDLGVLKELTARGIGFEICVSSNVALGAVSSLAAHPLHVLLENGAKIAICTDDPAYFATSPQREYEIVRTHFGLSNNELLEISKSAIDMAFCDSSIKTLVYDKLNNED